MNYEEHLFTVTALNLYLRQLFDINEVLQDVWIEGEVSDLKRPSSGHWYFTLKDANSQLRAVMFKTHSLRQRYIPEHGDKVRAHGRLGVYEARGEYQLYADAVLPTDQAGDLHTQFRQLWERLEEEGLFQADIKRPLPNFPARIGVVTSASTAAFQDIQHVLRRRYPLAEVILSQTPVQGEDAAPQIVRALRRIDAYGVDVILIARGGGSLEDLWCFNDERIARAIRDTRAPVVTGVGHETDTTLVDGAADRRAPTPSAGAELIAPSIDDLRLRLQELRERGIDAIQGTIEVNREDIDDLRHKLRLLSPMAQVNSQRERLANLRGRLIRTMQQHIQMQRQLISIQQRALDLSNPQHLLAKGYAIVTRLADGQQLTDAQQVNAGEDIHIRLAVGTLTAVVQPSADGKQNND